ALRWPFPPGGVATRERRSGCHQRYLSQWRVAHSGCAPCGKSAAPHCRPVTAKEHEMTESNVLKAPGGRETDRPGLPPLVDVVEDATGIVLRADMPGVSKELLNVHVEGDTLTIEGEVNLEIPDSMEASHVEVTRPRYRRS